MKLSVWFSYTDWVTGIVGCELDLLDCQEEKDKFVCVQFFDTKVDGLFCIVLETCIFGGIKNHMCFKNGSFIDR